MWAKGQSILESGRHGELDAAEKTAMAVILPVIPAL
jgi:hypothetical protein